MVGRDLVPARGRPPTAASLRQSSSTTSTGGSRLSTAPSLWCHAPHPDSSPQPPEAAPAPALTQFSRSTGVGPTRRPGCPPWRRLRHRARVTEPAAFDARRHETNASVAHRQSLWQGVMPLQLAGSEAVAAPAQVASLLQQHAGEVYLEAVVEVVAEA